MKSRFSKLISIVTILSVVLMLAGNLFAQELSQPEIDQYKWRTIGPANFQGRISDIEALDNDFAKVLIAGASGGVWKSDNAGTTWETIFDNYGSASIGDVERSQKNPDVIWVGTGEANNRNSVAWGDGVYKSEDGGKTFKNMGLKDTYQIAKVRIHPKKDNTVFVAAIGNLWAYNGQRGLYKTTNGGKKWEKLTNGLPDDGKTGATDLVIDPKNPDVMYVAMYQRIRQPWRFDSGGENGGIYKTTNGGKKWEKLTKGLPEGATGRIGLDLYKKDSKILMAWVEAEFHPNARDEDYKNMKKLGSGIYRSENGGKSWKYVNRTYNRPFYYSQVRMDTNDSKKVYFIATNYQYSEDGGKTLKTKGGYGQNVEPFDLHVDYHAMWIDPNNSDRYYIGNDGGAAISHDGGMTHKFFDNINVAQFYAIGVDMREPYYVYGGLQDNGSWAGPSNSRNSYGVLTDHWYKVGGGDGFFTKIDPNDWTTLYVESQGGYLNRMNVKTRQSVGIVPQNEKVSEIEIGGRTRNINKYRYNWSAPVEMSPHNSHTLYFGSNHLFKSVNKGDSWETISPDLTTNDPNKKDQFDTGGLTNDFTGAETHCTIVTISESPITPGLIWIGTDDGNIQVTRNGGQDWENTIGNLSGVPEATWVSRVTASNFDEGTAYATLEDHRRGNFATYVYKTTDYGKTWTSISSNLPEGNSAYVIKEDRNNKDLLFVGTEFGFYMSLNGGKSWQKFMNGLPTVAVHDMEIHPRDNDIILGTHGRGIWILDDISALQQMTEKNLEEDVFMMDNRPAVRWLTINKDQGEGWVGSDFYRGENPKPGANISFYMKDAGQAELLITDITGNMKKAQTIEAASGINALAWDMRFDMPELTAEEEDLKKIASNNDLEYPERIEAGEKLVKSLAKRGIEMSMNSFFRRGRGGRQQGPPAGAGEYLVKLTVNGTTYTNKIVIRNDPLIK